MQLGLTVSILLHFSVLVWAFISLQSPDPFRVPEPEPVEVALVTSEDLVRLTKGDRDAKQLEAQQAESPKEAKKEQPRPKRAATAPPPAAPPPPPSEAPARSEPPKAEPARDPVAKKIAALPPEPKGPTPEEIKQKEAAAAAKKAEAAKAEQARKAAEKKRADAKKKAAEDKKRAAEAKKRAEQKRAAEAKRKAQEAKKKKQFNADRIAALLNKVPDRAPPAGAPQPPVTETKARGPVAGAAEGQDTQLTASQRSLLGVMMKRAVSRCWNINSGLDGIDRMVVEVEVRLRPDGRLEQPPRVVNSGSGALFADAANSAVRALMQCEPYDLPEQFYAGGWDHMVVTFDPQRMF